MRRQRPRGCREGGSRQSPRAGADRHLPVVTHEQKLVGIITDRDVRQGSASRLPQFAVYDAPEQLQALQVQCIMTTHVLTIRRDTPVADAGQRLLEQRLGCLPVIRADNVVEGILTVTDLISAYVTLQGGS